VARDYENYSKDALIVHIHELEKQLKNNKYGLYWDKSIEQEAVVRQCKNHIPVLKRQEDLCMVDNPVADTHILIEGDNFHALTTMNMMCGNQGFADVIYIDPPYNTGRTFLYNDRIVDDDDGYKHSKWLSFMEKRLRLAWRILKHTGTIFISINGFEYAQLKMLCDSLFDVNNYVGTLTWESTTQPTNAGKAKFGLQQKTETILMYTNHKSQIPGYNLNYSNRTKNYPHTDPEGKQCRYDIIEKSDAGGYNRETMKFKILGRYPRVGKRWQIGEGTARELERTNRVAIVDGIVKKITYPEDELVDLKYVPFWSHLRADEFGTAQVGKAQVEDIMGYNPGFDTVKPTQLIEHLLYHTTNSEDKQVIVDFFVGTGTTMQSVLQLNKEDGGHRKCIACTDNEGNICSDITYPRIKTVISGKRNDGSEYSEGIPANLMYYKTDFIENSRDTDQAKYCLVEKVDELLCIIEETYLAKERTDYFSHYETLSGDKHTFIYSEYYNDLQFADFTEHINAVDGEKIVYMFSTDNTIDIKLFEGMDVTVKPIPSKIYEIYKEIVEDIKRGEQ